MKSNIVIYWLLAIFFAIVSVIYIVWTTNSTVGTDFAGGTALALSSILFILIAFYIGVVHKNQGGETESDTETAEINDGDPNMGQYSPWSWWPIFLAAVLAVFILGLCIGGNYWLCFFGLPFLIVALVGWVYEYYRGNFAR